MLCVAKRRTRLIRKDHLQRVSADRTPQTCRLLSFPFIRRSRFSNIVGYLPVLFLFYGLKRGNGGSAPACVVLCSGTSDVSGVPRNSRSLASRPAQGRRWSFGRSSGRPQTKPHWSKEAIARGQSPGEGRRLHRWRTWTAASSSRRRRWLRWLVCVESRDFRERGTMKWNGGLVARAHACVAA